MNRKDELYYLLKETRQQIEFYEYRADRNYRGAKVRVRNLKTKLSSYREEFNSIN